jgi:hypothetical protein
MPDYPLWSDRLLQRTAGRRVVRHTGGAHALAPRLASSSRSLQGADYLYRACLRALHPAEKWGLLGLNPVDGKHNTSDAEVPPAIASHTRSLLVQLFERLTQAAKDVLAGKVRSVGALSCSRLGLPAQSAEAAAKDHNVEESYLRQHVLQTASPQLAY